MAWLMSHFLKTAIQWLNFLPSFLFFSFFSDKMSDLAKAILELSILLPQTPELLGSQTGTIMPSTQFHL